MELSIYCVIIKLLKYRRTAAYIEQQYSLIENIQPLLRAAEQRQISKKNTCIEQQSFGEAKQSYSYQSNNYRSDGA